MVRITLPGGRDAAPIATAGALAYALLTRYDGEPTHHGALQVVAVVVVAMLVGVAPHVVAGRAPSLDTLARRLLVVAFAAAVFRATEAAPTWSRRCVRQPLALVMVGIVLATLLVDAVLAAAVRAGTDGAPFLAVLRNEVRAQAGIGSAIGATGALIALAAQIMGAWALPVFVLPLLLTQFSFRRYAAIRESSLQTIRALSRTTELGGYTEAGHSRRVSQLSVAVGRELGMSDPELRDLEYAALMHDIGQLSLSEPIPGGATVVAAPADQRRIASLGADVIRQTGVLDEVAHIVDQQAEPYRRAHEMEQLEVPLASRIIKAVNAYDDLVGESYEPTPTARGARAAAARDGLRVRPRRRGLARQDSQPVRPARRLNPSGRHQQQADTGSHEYVPGADDLRPTTAARQVRRRRASRAAVELVSGSRIASSASARSARDKPARAAASTDTGIARLSAMTSTLSSSPSPINGVPATRQFP